MDNIYLLLIIITPLLFSTFLINLYSYIKSEQNKKAMIMSLANENSKIIDKNKQDIVITKNDSFLAKKIKFAGFHTKGAEFIFILISLGFGFLASSFIFLIANSMVIFIATLIIFSFFPYLVLINIVKVREEEFNFSLKEIIDKVTSMMKSGVGFEQALKKSILTCKSKLTKNIFSIYINEKSIIGEDKCFEKMFEMIESRELRIFYLTISIGRKSGGKFSNTLEKLRKALNDQGEIKQEITASTREVKIGTFLIIGITVLIYIMLNASLENALNSHFFGSDIGKIQFFFIMVWVGFGIFVNSLLSKIK